MELITWATAPVVGAAFLASFVEAVEALTIVLAVGAFQGWRPALTGTFAAILLLLALILALGPLLGAIPISALQFIVGVLLLLFGMGWLRKAILRAAGVIALHDEAAAYAQETAQLQEEARSHAGAIQWIAGLTAFKAVTLEGIEVVFIVIALGSGKGMLWLASIGAIAACALVVFIGLLVHKPLARVPENTLKFGVGVMLSAFGTYWAGEGLGISWPGSDLAIMLFAAIFLAVGLILVAQIRRPIQENA